MEGDIFESRQKNTFSHQEVISDDQNFFMQPENNIYQNSLQTEPSKRLNDYDSNILREGAYKDVKDEVFRLEYKISKTEDELKEIDKQIQAANEIYDYFSVNSLNVRKTKLKKDLLMYKEMYNEISLSAKISGNLSFKIKDKLADAGKKIECYTKNILSKIPGKFSSVLEVRNSLHKLENINKSVDELMNCKYPYGEADYRYEQLSRYIARANTIQSEIYKFMK